MVVIYSVLESIDAGMKVGQCQKVLAGGIAYDWTAPVVTASHTEKKLANQLMVKAANHLNKA